MRTLVISASGRKGGTIEKACKKHASDIQDEAYEYISLFDYRILPCTGCLRCTKSGNCCLDDDFNTVYEKILKADHIVLGTPVYCHSVPGSLKTLMDRCCSKVVPFMDVDTRAKLRDKLAKVREYQERFSKNAPLKGKTFSVITACSTPSKNNADIKSAFHTIKQFIEEEMKAKITQDIRYTDTLFQFKPLGIEEN